MIKPAVFLFEAPFSFSGEIDDKEGVIRNVAVITAGVEAKGHKLEVDDTCVDQVVACGAASDKVQVKLDHKSGVKDICGYVTNFRRVGNKCLADWHLLQSHEEYDKIIEKARKMPGQFGLSAAFAGPKDGEKIRGGKFAARCTELLAVDCVAMPAANPAGLFSVKEVDNSKTDNMANENIPAAQPTLAEIMTAVQGLAQTVGTLVEGRKADEAWREQIDAQLQSGEPYSLEELQDLLTRSDDDLAAEGATRAEVQAAIEALSAPAASHDSPADAGANAAVAAANTQLAALRRQVTELSRKIDGDKERDEIEAAFATFEEKVDALTTELSASRQRETALTNTLRLHGTKAAAPAGETVKLFSANPDEGDETVHAFERLVTTKFEAGKAEKITKTAALELAMKENPRLYAEYRAHKGYNKLADA